MAVVTGFEKIVHKTPRPQPTSVTCYWSILPDRGSGPILQIDTRGSTGREFPAKQSQTLQLTTQSAKQLFEILRAEFGF